MLRAHEEATVAARWRFDVESDGAALAGLLLFGALAACAVSFLRFGLHQPGHAILRAVLPMGVGLMCFPRRGAGLAMGAGAAVALGGLAAAGLGPGVGAATSLLAAGPLLDLALRRARSGRGVYVALVLAGLSGNLAALAVRCAGKALAHGGSAPLSAWLPRAAVSYPAWGIAAGVIAAAACFRAR